MQRNATERNGTQRNATGRNGTQWDGGTHEKSSVERGDVPSRPGAFRSVPPPDPDPEQNYKSESGSESAPPVFDRGAGSSLPAKDTTVRDYEILRAWFDSQVDHPNSVFAGMPLDVAWRYCVAVAVKSVKLARKSKCGLFRTIIKQLQAVEPDWYDKADLAIARQSFEAPYVPHGTGV